MTLPRRRLYPWEPFRIWTLLAVMACGLAVLAGRLAWLQLSQTHRFEGSLAQQSIRRIWLPGRRGAVTDRQGRRLIENRPAYALVVYLEELRRPGPWSRTIDAVDAMLDEMAGAIGLPREVTREDIERHIQTQRPIPLAAWRDLGDSALARWAESALRFRGVDVQPMAVRHYPRGALAGHVLGQVGRADFMQPEEGQPYHHYVPDMIGRSGIERRFDETLRGEPGGRLVRVDVSGFRHEDVAVIEPTAGRDLVLAIDLEVQALAERALNGRAGAIVVVDPRNGDVLAMASYPSFDPNEFVPAMPLARWRELRDDPLRPLFHRAASGAYAPGSTFKPVAALASIVNGFSNAQTRIVCDGAITLGRATRFRCWERSGHGPLDLRESIARSCNVYYYRLALNSGAEPVAHMARALGLGRRTGIDLDFEAPGLVPDDAWKRRVHGDAWRDGDTCNLSIGQGAIAVTPLQMAMLVATLANGGTLYRPRLVLGMRDPADGALQPFAPEIVNALQWNPAQVRGVREGMIDAVMSPYGTGRLARVPGVIIAGKTGTAEYGPRGAGLKRGWMIAYAPADAPRFAVAMVVDEADSGGATVAPRLRGLFEGLFLPEPENPS